MGDMTATIGRPPVEAHFGENTAEALRQAQRAMSAAQAALAAAGVGEYVDTAAGLADTAIGETFWTDAGDGTGVIYRHDSGPVATFVGRFVKDPTESGAADIIGAVGGTVQALLTGQAGYISALQATTKADDSNNRARTGVNVAPFHITTGGRTQGGADLNGFGTVLYGADIATGVDNDATTTTGIGTYNLTVEGVKSYGVDFHGYRSLEFAEDILYVGGFCIDVWRNLVYGRNSFGAAAKFALYVESSEDVVGAGVSTLAGGGEIEKIAVLGNLSFDNSGGTDRTALSNFASIGNLICRNAEGDLGGSVFGGHGIGQNSAVTPFAMAIWGGSAFGGMISPSLGGGLGWGCASSIENEAFVLSLGALSDPGYGGSTAVGAEAVCTGASQLQLGDTGTTSYAFGAVQDRSDRRDKIDIVELDLGMDFIRLTDFVKFRRNYRDAYRDVQTVIEMVDEEETVEMPVPDGIDDRGQKKWKINKITQIVKRPKVKVIRPRFDDYDKDAHARGDRAGKRFHPGVIAQQVKEVCEKLGVDFAGLQWHAHHNDNPENQHTGEDVFSIAYQDFIPVMGKALQECDARLIAIEERLAKIEAAA